jgi:hypothetical protein
VDNVTALNVLQSMLNAGTVPARDLEFTKSLVGQFNAKGALSKGQWPWVLKLAERLSAPPAAPKAVADFSKVYAMFATAKQKLKYPKVHLMAGSTAVKLYVSGARSRVPDTVNVVGDDHDQWYGRVFADGRWEGGRGTPEVNAQVETVLTALAADPERVAAEHGKLTGNCCFCNRPLGEGEDKRSVEVGYGPVCADKFGLQWGKKPGRVVRVRRATTEGVAA